MTDPIATAARFLLDHLEWIRHHPGADEHLAAIEACAGVIRGVASGPKERRYLGPCGAEIVDTDPPDDVYAGCPNPGRCIGSWVCHAGDCKPEPAPICEGAVYGGIGGRWASCRECGARYDQAARIAERAELAHRYAYTAVEIEKAYPGVVHRTNIGRWHKAGRLTPHGEIDGCPLYLVDDVLALVEGARPQQQETASVM